MVHGIVRIAYDDMRLPALNRHHDCSTFESILAPESVSRPMSPSITEHGHDNDKSGELLPILSAMQRQESEIGAYNPSGKYTYRSEQLHDGNKRRRDNIPDRKNVTVVDEKCRAKMLDWCTKMVDYFDIDRSIVAVSAYYQDRFLGTETGTAAQNNRALFRVVSVTSLYIAIKLRVPHRWNVTAHAFAQLCQGAVSGDEINDMELDILFALGWNVHPPIPDEYAEAYLDLIFNLKDCIKRRTASVQSDDDSVLGESLLPSSSDGSIQHHVDLQELKNHIVELVHYQLEIALQDSRLFQVRSSVIATAAVLNALEGVMNETPYFHRCIGGASFFQESIVLTLNTMISCKIATESEMESTRSALLSSVASPTEGSEDVDSAHSMSMNASRIRKGADDPMAISLSVSSSPTSASKFWSKSKMHEPAVTPQNVLPKVFVVHHI